jgi:uncharacterized protein DUF3987
VNSIYRTDPAWPSPPSQEALHGLAGDIVRTIEPHTESDPAALLLQLLVAFGNLIGRGLHFQAEADRHSLNLFTVLVGETSKARKGTSWSHIRKLFAMIDTIWPEHCIQTGLSSGEGLIHAVRDPIGEDSGALDKRLLVVESEFASPLRMMSRDGNTLSPVIRQAWDGTPLQIMTRLSPMKATNPHVSLIAHVTRAELRRELTRTDAGSGFGNRFLWACVCRSKTLPDGGCLPVEQFEKLVARVKRTLETATSLGNHELRRDAEASTLWHSIYAELSEGKLGLLGAVTSRAEAQVMRLACLYAVLDEAKEVRAEHLKAAQALWNYCETSARFIFGDALGDTLADELLPLLRQNPDGMTRTEVSAAFGRNRPATDINRALDLLSRLGLATPKSEHTSGRPAERWFASGQLEPLGR